MRRLCPSCGQERAVEFGQWLRDGNSSPCKPTVVYHSKDGKETNTYDALEWLAAMT